MSCNTPDKYVEDSIYAIKYALVLFLEKREQKGKNRYVKEKKIDTTQIDEILGASFGIAPTVMGKIRKCVQKGKEYSFPNTPKEFSFYFQPSRLKELCNDIGFENIITQEELDQIWMRASGAIPLHLILDKSHVEFCHPDILSSVDEWFHVLESLFQIQPNLPYWNIFFQYLHKLRHEDEAIWNLLSNFPSISEHEIHNIHQHVNNIIPSLTVSETNKREDEFHYLKEFTNDLSELYKRKKWDKSGFPYCFDWKKHVVRMVEQVDSQDKKVNYDAFLTLNLLDLGFIYSIKEEIIKIAVVPIRPVDLELIFSIVTKLNFDAQEEVFKMINEKISKQNEFLDTYSP